MAPSTVAPGPRYHAAMAAPADPIRLLARPLRPDEYEDWYRHISEGYAQDIALHGGTDPDTARRKSARDMASLLPRGLGTPDHEILVLEASDERVGLLWVGPREVDERRVLFIWDVEIEEAHRGRGFGRQAMLLAEELARERGLGRIELNVFGGNEVARNLYRSLGYAERAVAMGKDVEIRPVEDLPPREPGR